MIFALHGLASIRVNSRALLTTLMNSLNFNGARVQYRITARVQFTRHRRPNETEVSPSRSSLLRSRSDPRYLPDNACYTDNQEAEAPGFTSPNVALGAYSGLW